MATPSVLTVPSMYGDGILYSGPTVFSNELVTNGNFNSVSDWTLATGWTINNGKLVGDSIFGNAVQNINFTNGKIYRVIFTISDYVKGKVRFQFTGGSSVNGTARDANGVYTQYTVATANHTDFKLRGVSDSGGFTGKIDNVSVKEITQGSDFDFTRDTSGTRINEDGYIEDVPYNLVSYSQDFNNSVWNKLTNTTVTANQIVSPDGRQNADEFSATSTSTSLISVQDSFSVSLNVDYVISFFAKKGSVRYVQLFNGSGQVTGNPRTNFDLQDGNIAIQDGGHTSSIENFGNGWYRCTTKVTTLSTNLQVYISGVSTSTASRSATSSWTAGDNFYVWGAQLVKGDKSKNYLPTTDRKNLPRLNYPVYGGCPSLLLEPQRTNSIPHSTDFSNAAWTKNEVTVTANSIISPEGITNASLIKESSANSLHWLGDAVSVTSGTSYSASVYAKKKERSVFQWTLSTNFLNASFANYDLDKGVVSATGGAVTAQIIAMPNDWYRCIITFTATSTNTGTPLLSLQDSPTAARGAAYQGDGSSGLYLYGAQFEAGSYATSLIHTSGATVTRNQDTANNAGLGTTNTFNNSEGVLYCEIKALSNDQTTRKISISDGTTSNAIYIAYITTSNSVRGLISSSGNTQVKDVVLNITDYNKLAVRYNNNGTGSFWINGINYGTINTGSAFNGNISQLQFQREQGGTPETFFGKTKAVAVYKTALTDTELANLTSYNNHDLFIPYRSRMQMISADQELQCTEHDITRFL